jgi:hypothetical protein
MVVGHQPHLGGESSEAAEAKEKSSDISVLSITSKS